jgi:hypothetical protein
MIFHHRLTDPLLLLLVLATACGGGGDSPTPPNDGDGNGDGTGEIPPFEPNPLDVTLNVDAGRAVTGLVTPAGGGTISATGADGTSYTLVVPPNALFDAVEVRMTPVTAIDGSPLSGGLVGAVQLEPTGLRLVDVATLTIVPVQAIDVATTVGFGTEHGGSDFHLMPGFVAGPALVLRLNHFSVHGFAKGTTLEQRRAIDRVPRSIENYIAAIIAAERKNALLGTQEEEPVLPPGVNELIKSLVVEQLILPRFEAGRTDCFAFLLAVTTYVGWIRQHTLMGQDAEIAPGDLQAINAAANAGAANCAEELMERCVQHDVGLAVALSGMGTTLVFLGVQFDQIAQNLRKCLHFEVEYDAAFRWGVSEDFYGPHGRSTVPLPLLSRGAAPLEVVSFEYLVETLEECSRVEQTPVGTTFSVDSAVAEMELLRESTPTSRVYTGEMRVHRLDLYINPGQMHYVIDVTCPETGSHTLDFGPFYFAAFHAFHQDEAVRNERDEVRFYLIAFPVAQVRPAELFADKSYVRSTTSEGVPVSESTTFKVFHRPQP